MAQEEKKQTKAKQQEKKQKSEPKAKKPETEDYHESLIRIFGYDIPGSKNIYTGLTKIKGISWAISNVACTKLKIPHTKRIVELSKDEIAKIETFLKNLEISDYMKNRRNELETGKTSHKFGADLDMVRDFDIKRLKKIKSYKGVRHTYRLPVRGQRTRSHFRSQSTTKIVRKPKKV